MAESVSRRPIWIICLLLTSAVLAAFWPALSCGFINFDDPAYVTANPAIHDGLTWHGIRWAMSTGQAANWHPLTWVSHMADIQMYGLNPRGHHLTSILFHAANSALLFLILSDMTGAMGRSAFVAAIFALHPLRVESVVWISERKDVLSAFFGLLAIWSYFKYQISKSKPFYAFALLFFALGLAAKPMLVTLPFVFLLLDIWPMKRTVSWKLVLEKTPFLLLSAAACIVTYAVQNPTMANFPATARWANAPVACVRYLAHIFWPANLSFFYAYRAWPATTVVVTVLLLALISGIALLRLREEPYLAVGWAWFLGMLLPVIGLVQVGSQSMADRYTYLPGIGVSIMVVWAIQKWAPNLPAIVIGVLCLCVCIVLTREETRTFQNSETLWRAALREDPKNLVALDNLTRCLIDSHQLNEALDRSREALAIRLTDAEAEDNMAVIFSQQGNFAQALSHAQESVALQPQNPHAYDTMAGAYLKIGQADNAIAAYRKAVELDPSMTEAWCNLGFALLQQHRAEEATAAYKKALDLDPNYALAHNDLGNILLQSGRMDEALAHFVRATQIMPEFGEAHYNIAEILLKKGHTQEALAEYQKTLAILPNLTQARARIAEILRQQGGKSEQ
ncbi:MAG TPA: tetratricopeptide repeat protein [Verrucomicrobiae bacterium]|jgi:tetratricopeptide (TPR) repeat protein